MPTVNLLSEYPLPKTREFVRDADVRFPARWSWRIRPPPGAPRVGTGGAQSCKKTTFIAHTKFSLACGLGISPARDQTYPPPPVPEVPISANMNRSRPSGLHAHGLNNDTPPGVGHISRNQTRKTARPYGAFSGEMNRGWSRGNCVARAPTTRVPSKISPIDENLTIVKPQSPGDIPEGPDPWAYRGDFWRCPLERLSISRARSGDLLSLSRRHELRAPTRFTISFPPWNSRC